MRSFRFPLDIFSECFSAVAEDFFKNFLVNSLVDCNGIFLRIRSATRVDFCFFHGYCFGNYFGNFPGNVLGNPLEIAKGVCKGIIK